VGYKGGGNNNLAKQKSEKVVEGRHTRWSTRGAEGVEARTPPKVRCQKPDPLGSRPVGINKKEGLIHRPNA